MKKLFLLLTFACLAYTSQATHLMGGELTVKHISGNQYQIQLTQYRDTLGIPMYSSTILEIDTLVMPLGFAVHMATDTIFLDSSLSVPLIPNFPYGVEVGVYTDTITLIPGKAYRFYNEECCRNWAIRNMQQPLDENLALYTVFEVPLVGANNSPDFMLMPVTYFPINTAINYNPLPYDLDGDSLSWELIPALDEIQYPYLASAVVGFVPPAADPSGPFTMNPVSGEITWTPNQLGNFVQSFEVSEYRNGVKVGSIIRDYQYVVISPPANNQSLPIFRVQSNNATYDTTKSTYYASYIPGQRFTFTLEGTDADPATTLSLVGNSEIFGFADPATFDTTIAESKVTGVLNWTPPAGFDREVTVVFRLQDGLWTSDFTLILKPADITSVNTVPEIVTNIQLYPNPTEGDFSITFENKEAGNVSVDIYNYLGQKINKVYDGKLPSGPCNIRYQEELASGLYLVTVSHEGQFVKSIPLYVK